MEELLKDQEDLDRKIEILEKMKEHTEELIELDDEDYDLDFDLNSLKHSIEKRIEDYKMEKENIQENIQDIRNNDGDYFNYKEVL